MLSDSSTEYSSSDDEIFDVAYLYLSCTSSRCDVHRSRILECLTSDIDSQGLNCPVCNQKYKLKVFTETGNYRVMIEREGGDHIDSQIQGTLRFPEDWRSFYIERVH
jgi:hypothetical protein